MRKDLVHFERLGKMFWAEPKLIGIIVIDQLRTLKFGTLSSEQRSKYEPWTLCKAVRMVQQHMVVSPARVAIHSVWIVRAGESSVILWYGGCSLGMLLQNLLSCLHEL